MWREAATSSLFVRFHRLHANDAEVIALIGMVNTQEPTHVRCAEDDPTILGYCTLVLAYMN